MERYQIFVYGTGDYEIYDSVAKESRLGKCQDVQEVIKALGEEPLKPEGGEECRTLLKMIGKE